MTGAKKFTYIPQLRGKGVKKVKATDEVKKNG